MPSKKRAEDAAARCIIPRASGGCPAPAGRPCRRGPLAAATYQPDGEIRAKGVSPIVFIGGGVYNSDATGQTVTRSTLVGQKAVYFLRLFNDGNVSDSFTVTGTAGGGGWTVAYFDAATGGNDITAQVTGAGWVTRSLARRVDLAYLNLRVEVTPAATVANNASKAVLVTFASSHDPTKVDAVQGVTMLEVPTPGRYVVFSSNRSGGAGGWDVYLYDRVVGALVGLPGLNSTGDDYAPSISADGRFIVFKSNRAGGAGGQDIYLYDRSAGALVPLPGLNSSADDEEPTISDDGRFIAFVSTRAGGAGGQDVYLYDRNKKTLVGLPGLNSASDDADPRVSANGRFIAFSSNRGAGGKWHVYLYDREETSLVSLPGLNSAANDDRPSVSADGRYIAFGSDRAGGAGSDDVYLYDRSTSSLVALPGLKSAAADTWPGISDEGRYLTFSSDRPGGAGGWDVYLYDRTAGSLIPLPGLNSAAADMVPKLN